MMLLISLAMMRCLPITSGEADIISKGNIIKKNRRTNLRKRPFSSCVVLLQGSARGLKSLPVAVPEIFYHYRENFDRCHSLNSLFLPPAALVSLPPAPFLRSAERRPFRSLIVSRNTKKKTYQPSDGMSSFWWRRWGSNP